MYKLHLYPRRKHGRKQKYRKPDMRAFPVMRLDRASGLVKTNDVRYTGGARTATRLKSGEVLEIPRCVYRM